MLVALVVHYSDTLACAAAVVFDDWPSETSRSVYTTINRLSAEYQPGQFYLRELSPLMHVIGQIAEDVEFIIIDGYCRLAGDRQPGLGVHLYEALDQSHTIVGGAKSRYRQAEEVYRGNSGKPLFVTAIGISYSLAEQQVASMAGQYRIPSMLKAVDRLARDEL